jgi:signal transduction histidine kinase
MANELLSRFQSDGSNSGVGLSGMREWVSELGGHLKIHSSPTGTVVAAQIPLARAVTAKAGEAEDFYHEKRGSAA